MSHNNSFLEMAQKAIAKVLDIFSFIVLVATVVIYLLFKDEAGRIDYLILMLFFIVIFLKMIGMQFRYNALKKEYQTLKKNIKIPGNK